MVDGNCPSTVSQNALTTFAQMSVKRLFSSQIVSVKTVQNIYLAR